MILVPDTNALFFYFSDSPKLSVKVGELIDSGSGSPCPYSLG
jgi:hypothetical protein